MSSLMDKVKALPELPGCYIYKNIDNEIIYIGKSKCLKKRVRQYFQGMDKKEGKLLHLVKDIYDFDYIVTQTETDALLLECELIKKHMPYYNVLMKQNKSYPYINIKLKQEYPGIYVAYEQDSMKEVSFGCFYNADDAMDTIKLINSVWKTPLCNKESFIPEDKKRECFNRQIGRCDAPCKGDIDKGEYQKRIKEIIKFLRGDNKIILFNLRKEMYYMSKCMEFEKAAVLRNRFNLLSELQKRTKRFQTDLKGKDFCVFLRAYNEKCFSIFYVHDAEVINRVIFEYNKELQLEDFIEFSSEIIGKKQMVQDGVVTAMCITKIAADKLYVDITGLVKRKNIQGIGKRIYVNYKEYCKTSVFG